MWSLSQISTLGSSDNLETSSKNPKGPPQPDARSCGPRPSSNPVTRNKGSLGAGIEAPSEQLVLRNLDNEGRYPDGTKKDDTGPVPAGKHARWRPNEQSNSSCEFNEHEWKNDKGNHSHVFRMVPNEALPANAGEKGILNELDEPDEPGQKKRAPNMRGEKYSVHATEFA